ncbi:M48 family metallopeptidase [Prosthecobacter fluviatilis]|uniref:M48 family metallopeptidase n=1 Tax=Prosthecobacter fluviatilis TaxID=445931 RepID=A0ABW0KWB1_9BACT
MSFSNPWFIAAVVGVLGVFHLEIIATFLNLAQFRHALPARLKAIFSEETVQKAGEYAGKSSQLDLLRSTFSVGALVLFWWSGGFDWLQRWSSGWGWSAVYTGMGVIGVLLLAQNLLSLPFDAWDTFKIEAEYGFNRTTVGTFIGDRVKGLLLTALLGGPLLGLILWFFQTQAHAVLYTWLTVAGFSIVMAWLSPRLLMPLFLKFKPLDDGPLREGLLALAARLQFPVVDISVVDGSRRSSKANAFLSGFGKNKRIALYDTLIEKHSQAELEAILAHEIGHHKCRHVPQQLILGLLESGLMFYLLHAALQSPEFFRAFGVSSQPLGLGLVLFSIIYQPASLLLGLLSSALSRRHEFQADAYARTACGSAPLMDGLKKLSLDHLTHPNPHALTVWLHYSHPPIGQRLAALEA